MKLFRLAKDGGPLSHVWGLFVVEIKSLFSVVLLKFSDGSREAYHTHAFNAWTWVLWGKIVETTPDDTVVYGPSLWPINTPRERFHKVSSIGTSWAVTFRGPWADTWRESTPSAGTYTLTHGRKVVKETT